MKIEAYWGKKQKDGDMVRKALTEYKDVLKSSYGNLFCKPIKI